MPICIYCGEERKLIDAHIIPRSFWQVDYTWKEPLALIGNSEPLRPKRSQHGIYDNNILCADCDNRLGLLDQHVTENMLKKAGSVHAHGGAVLRYDNADPIKVFDFVLSIAWRASKSSHDYFKRVSLGPYENNAKAALMGDKDSRSKFDVLISEFNLKHTGFLNPHYGRFDGVRILTIYASRFTFYVKVDNQRIPYYFVPYIVTDGKPVFTIAREWEGSKQFQAMRQLVMQNPYPKWFPKRQ